MSHFFTFSCYLLIITYSVYVSFFWLFHASFVDVYKNNTVEVSIITEVK